MTSTDLLGEIRQARDRIKDAIHVTPCAPSLALSRMLECRLSLKLENLQITGSFKPRGASNKLLQMPAAQRRQGVIAASAGNHAQGVAMAANHLGIDTLVVMPASAARCRPRASGRCTCADGRHARPCRRYAPRTRPPPP